jgi:hypothetical protein
MRGVKKNYALKRKNALIIMVHLSTHGSHQHNTDWGQKSVLFFSNQDGRQHIDQLLCMLLK